MNKIIKISIKIIITLIMSTVLALELAYSIDTSDTYTITYTTQNNAQIALYEPVERITKTTEKRYTYSTINRDTNDTKVMSLSTELSTLSTEEMQAEIMQWRYALTDYEAELIAYIISFEESNYDALAGCAEVILNRVESYKFPDTVEDVIFQRKQFYGSRFISKGNIPNIDKESDEYKAVMAVFRDGESVVSEAVFFANEKVKKTKIANGLYEVEHIGETRYYGQK